MSRLIDELNRVAREAPQPIGFRATHPAISKPRILLVASLTQIGNTDRLADCVDGADALVLRLAKSHLAANTIPKIAGALPDIPWGGWLEDADVPKMETFIEAGCDFVIFPADSLVSAAPQDDNIGKILQVESTLSDGLLRAINDLPVDAVLTTDAYKTGDSMAWHHLMHFQRLANLLSQPVLVSAPLKVTDSELKSLWEAGVDGVVVEADSGQPGALKDLRRIVSELPPRSLRRRGKAEALLPRIGRDETEIGKTEEEEEEE